MKEKVFFTNSKGIKLCGIISNPTDDVLKPIIVLCHGFTTSKNNHTNTQLEMRLNEKEISTFRFDFFGHGESEGNFEEITISEGVDDILRAIDYLKSLGYLKIGLVGSSFGGITSLIASSRTSDLYLLALKSPVSDYFEVDYKRRTKKEMEEWKSKGFVAHISGSGEERRLNYTFFDDFKNNNGYEAARGIKIPTLIVHGDTDKTVPLEQSQKTVGLLKNGRLEIVKGAGHKYSNPGEFKKMISLIMDFIVKNS
jgi:uncharacterized protein